MENFVLYEELGKGENDITYKGRRKGTINFVAIHCIDKCKRPEVTNTVRITHDISHNNVVKFHEWYETSNHLWLVAELCTGGSLDLLIKQDGNLPESSIRTFGQDLVIGLHYIHSLGILFNDMQPSKILLDSSGVLKYANFGLSKVEGENLQELFLKFADAGEQWNQETFEEDLKKIKSTGSLTYMAPEVMSGQEPSVLSDLWSFGCVLYEMFTGHPPFLAESEEQLKEKVMNKPFPPPRVKGTRFSGMASPDFLSLIEGLLQKDPIKRTGWSGLVTHLFWQGSLSQIAKDFTMSQELRDSSVATGRSSVFEHGGSSALGKIKGVELRRSMERPMSNLDVIDATNRPGSTLGDYMRPKTAPGNNGEETLFTLSARPHTAVPPDDRVTSPHKHIHSPMPTREVVGATKDEDLTDSSQTELLSYMFHNSDFVISPIVNNPKVQKLACAKFDTKVLPVPPFSVEKLTSLSEKDLTKHIKQILDNIVQTEKGPPSQKRIHLLHYVASITTSPFVSSLLLQNNALNIMARQLKDTPHVEVRIKLGRVMALVALHGEDLDEGTNVSEAMTTLTEIVRENVKNTKLKQGLFPALGEMLYLVAVQEQIRGQCVENWSVPSMTYTVIARSCREEDTTLNHIAAKIVENVSATKGIHAQKFVHNEMGQSLWYLFKHSTVDTVRCTALSALCRLTWHNAQVFQSVIDTVGLSAVLGALMLGISRVQQSIVTMFGALLASGSHLTRLIQDKDFLQKMMRLLESPSTIIRAKAFLVLYHFIRNNTDVLLNSCQARLVMYIERDSRRQTPREPRGDNQESWTFMSQCLDLLVNHIVSAVPAIFKDILSALDAVGGRKHPSAVQVKQLKMTLPHLPIFLHLVTSQVFRNHVVTEEFVMDVGRLLVHVNSIESGQTNIESASDKMKASIGVGEFITTVMSILEGISQHPTLLIEHDQIVMETILPTLAALMNCQNVDTKALSLRLFSQIASVYLSEDQYGGSDATLRTTQLHKIIAEHLMPLYEQILLDQDPLPSYGLKLLLAILEQNPAFVSQFERQGLVAVVFQVLLDHQSNPTSGAMQCIVGILNCLVGHRETNMQELYDQGLVDYLSTLFFEVSTVCLEGEDGCRDVKTANTMLQTLLDCLQNLFKHVSDVVRKALQAKKCGAEGSSHDAEVAEQLLLLNKPLTDLTSLLTHLGSSHDAEVAEQLLLLNKPLTDLTSLLTHLLCYEDSDIQDLSTKCLSLIVQLFGGENREALSEENMGRDQGIYRQSKACSQESRSYPVIVTFHKRPLDSRLEFYSKALKKAEAKKQKVLLRIIKRLVSTDKHHADSMRNHGDCLAQTIKSLVHTASSHADVALSSVAAEILKATGHLS